MAHEDQGRQLRRFHIFSNHDNFFLSCTSVFFAITRAITITKFYTSSWSEIRLFLITSTTQWPRGRRNLMIFDLQMTGDWMNSVLNPPAQTHVAAFYFTLELLICRQFPHVLDFYFSLSHIHKQYIFFIYRKRLKISRKKVVLKATMTSIAAR